ncbi:hypothetical protein AGLY_017072 [Aphis glycines]|uniref:Uncharacterized protein n=1 Tax=Aphis glycines TaxID=307491 RepID=A0A6G0SWQ3_APHGL|nr:hypothetical protein AGLY_017072 [Aphis glycines]
MKDTANETCDVRLSLKLSNSANSGSVAKKITSMISNKLGDMFGKVLQLGVHVEMDILSVTHYQVTTTERSGIGFAWMRVEDLTIYNCYWRSGTSLAEYSSFLDDLEKSVRETPLLLHVEPDTSSREQVFIPPFFSRGKASSIIGIVYGDTVELAVTSARTIDTYLLGTCDASIPLRIRGPRDRLPRVLGLRRSYQDSLRRSGNQDSVDARTRFSIARRKLRLTIKHSKEQSWRDLLDTVETNPWGKPYRIVIKKNCDHFTRDTANGREPTIEDPLSPMASPMDWNTVPSSKIQNLFDTFEIGELVLNRSIMKFKASISNNIILLGIHTDEILAEEELTLIFEQQTIFSIFVLELQKYNNEEESVFESITDFNNHDVIKKIKQINNIEKHMDMLSLRNIGIKVVIDKNLINSWDHEEFVQKTKSVETTTTSRPKEKNKVPLKGGDLLTQYFNTGYGLKFGKEVGAISEPSYQNL